jgi:NitT/TauT family transport system substrate-binding protein
MSWMDALTDAHEFIQKHRGPAVEIYPDEEKSKLSEAFIGQMLDSPDIRHTIVPHNSLKYAEFMYQMGSLRNRPASWQDFYFSDIHGVMGS